MEEKIQQALNKDYLDRGLTYGASNKILMKMTNKKTTLQPLPDINQQRKLVDRLPVLISARIRLNDEQRATLKTALHEFEKKITPTAAPKLPGSTVSSSSSYDPFQASLGLNRIVLADILGTRESLTFIDCS